MKEEQNPKQQTTGIKKFILKKRERKAIPTSQGNFFVRHLASSDLPTFSEYLNHEVELKPDKLHALGELAIKSFTCVEASSIKPLPLADDAYAKFSSEDRRALAEGIAEIEQLGPIIDEPVLASLGNLLKNRLHFYAKQYAESAASIKKAMDTNFGTMSESVKASIADSLTGIAAIRESLQTATPFSAIQKEIESQNRIFRVLPNELLSQVGHIKTLGLGPTADVVKRINEDQQRLYNSVPKSALEQFEQIERKTRASSLSSPEIDLSFPQPPPIAVTPTGRAAIAGEESARQLREVAGMAAEMTDKVANLSEVILTQVLPKWFQNLQDGASKTNESLQQAKTSVNLAKKAIFWSIGATVAMTMWQIWLAREYKLENDDQQNKFLELMSKQLKESQDLNKQLAEDSKKLSEQLTKMNQALSNVPFAKSPPPIDSSALGPAIGRAARAEER